MKFNYLLLFGFFTLVGFSQSKTTVKGKITDKTSRQPLSFVTISIKEENLFVQSDTNGEYSIELKSENNYTATLNLLGYKQVETNFSLNNEEVILNFELQKEEAIKMDNITVTASAKKTTENALLKDQQKASEIKQSIGSQELSRKGISDVEEGLTKVTGITKVESRGLFVRGLEERYDNLLINDLQTPSNSPFKKILPLDLFPTDIVGVIGVYKTFNPNNPGDFAGATINIETSEAQKETTKLTVGYNYTTGNNGNNFLIAEDANNTKGFFGVQKENRALPAPYGSISGVSLSSAEYKKGYENNSWNVNKSSAPINSSIGLTHTNKFKWGNNQNFNYILSINGDNKYQVRKGLDRTFLQGQGEYNNDLQRELYSYQTAASTLLGLKFKNNWFSITTNSMFIRTTESSIEDLTGVLENQKSNPNRFIRTNQFEQTNYFNNQLFATVNLTENGDHALRGGVSYVKTTYELPDRKFIVGEKVDDATIRNTYGGNTLNRQNFRIKGNYYISGLFEYNWKFDSENKEKKLSVGYNSFRNNLNSVYRFFSSRFNVPTTRTVNVNNINSQILTDIENGIIFEREESTGDYKTKLDQFVNAGYANLFWSFGNRLDINGGIRFEASKREINFREISNALDDPYNSLNQNNTYILPSVNAKYKISDNSNLRFASSKTITRPVLMEVLPIQFVDPNGVVKLGNSRLVDTDNLNFDLKFENFNSNKEMFVVGLFAKSIKNPIETIFQANATTLITYQNSKSAVLYGAEAEMILSLKRISQSLNGLSFGLNTSLMNTDVNIDLSQNVLENSDSRQLQGASNWIVNADLKYDFTLGKNKNTTSLIYNVKGKNIVAVGTAGLDHIYEMPFQRLDFVWTSKLSDHMDAKFSVDNILNPYQNIELGNNNKVQIFENSLLIRQYKRGTGVGLSLSYTF
jgi:outer membrane receptor protein involved in Fe transport